MACAVAISRPVENIERVVLLVFGKTEVITQLYITFIVKGIRIAGPGIELQMVVRSVEISVAKISGRGAVSITQVAQVERPIATMAVLQADVPPNHVGHQPELPLMREIDIQRVVV